MGGVVEKVEAFFDVCSQRGLSGKEGVLVPATNVRSLMLRADVAQAADDATHAAADAGDAVADAADEAKDAVAEGTDAAAEGADDAWSKAKDWADERVDDAKS